jgi:hypothetical protein
MVLQGAFDVGRTAKAGFDAQQAGATARSEKAGSKKKYGTVAAATATRHARKKKIKTKVANSNLKQGYLIK